MALIKTGSLLRSSKSDYRVYITGSFVKIEVGSTQYAHIKSSRPVQVFQYVKTTGNKDTDNADPAMMVKLEIIQIKLAYRFADVALMQ